MGEGAKERISERLNNGVVTLVAANGVSYLTSLIRERFLYQHEYGTHALDVVVVSLAVVAIVGNALGALLSFWWAAGRLPIAMVYLGGIGYVAVVGLVAVVEPQYALLLVYCGASTVFLLAIQRAAGAGRQLYALAAAITSPGLAIFIWITVGTRTTTTILLGYAAAALWQAAGAWVVGRGSGVAPSPSSAALLWPLVYITAVQVDGVADISLLTLGGRGWASACGFAYNAFSGAVVVLLGPIGAQALAGRLRLERPARILAAAMVTAGAFAALAPLVLHVLLHGGVVVGDGYRRVLILTLLYAPAIPFAIFWQLVTRSEHRDAERWRALAVQATVLFLVHLALLLVIVLFQAWVYVPLSTVGGFAALGIGRLISDQARIGAGRAPSAGLSATLRANHR